MEGIQAQKQQTGKQKKSWKREALEWALTILCAVAIAVPIRMFVFSPFTVQGTSMVDTLADREVVFATKFDYLAGDPARFDVVVCHYPNRKENFIKRVAGVPGDTVAVEGGYLYVNGERYEEAYIAHRPNYSMQPYTLAEKEYFVLGDNRSNSNDSHLVGPISRDMIVAHARAVMFPLNRVRPVR